MEEEKDIVRAKQTQKGPLIEEKSNAYGKQARGSHITGRRNR